MWLILKYLRLNLVHQRAGIVPYGAVMFNRDDARFFIVYDFDFVLDEGECDDGGISWHFAL